MDAIVLAQSLEAAKRSQGTISLRDLHESLARQGRDDLARAVRSLAKHLTSARQSINETVPWI